MSQVMDMDRGSKELKSPPRKLVKFFHESRDNWKAKYRELKRKCKLMSNQVRAVEASRARWAEVAHAAEQRVNELQQELERVRKLGSR